MRRDSKWLRADNLAQAGMANTSSRMPLVTLNSLVILNSKRIAAGGTQPEIPSSLQSKVERLKNRQSRQFSMVRASLCCKTLLPSMYHTSLCACIDGRVSSMLRRTPCTTASCLRRPLPPVGLAPPPQPAAPPSPTRRHRPHIWQHRTHSHQTPRVSSF
jgi:hypothetical protein